MTQELNPGEYKGKDFEEVWCKAVALWHWPGKCEGPHPTWQSCIPGETVWGPELSRQPNYGPAVLYRLTPPPKRTTVYDGKTYVLAEKVAPKVGTEYWCVGVDKIGFGFWEGHPWEIDALAANNVFLTEEDAQPWFDLGVKMRGGM